MLKILLWALISVAHCFALADINQKELVIIGICTWGPKVSSGNDCIHNKGNALATFYLDSINNKILVYNRITDTDVNFCHDNEYPKNQNDLIVANNFYWKGIRDEYWSGVTISSDLLDVVQASTGSRNYLQHVTKGSVLAYAPCYFRNIN